MCYDNNKVSLSDDSYEELFNSVQTLMEYDVYKYNLLNNPNFLRRCNTFNSRDEPTSTQDILVALIMHPLSGGRGISLFDELVYTSYLSEYHEEVEEGELNQIQPILKDAVIHLQSISAFTTTSSTGTTTEQSVLNNANKKTELTNTNTKLDLGGTSSDGPSKMGEGRDGPSHSPLPKVLVRSEEEALKLTINRMKEEYLPVEALPVSDESPPRAIFILPRAARPG